MHFLKEVAQHFFRHLEVCDDPSLERARDGDVRRCFAEHRFCFMPYRNDLAVAHVDGDKRWLVDHESFPFREYQCVSRPKVNTKVLRKTRCESSKHIAG